jgi:hypothetical protein
MSVALRLYHGNIKAGLWLNTCPPHNLVSPPPPAAPVLKVPKCEYGTQQFLTCMLSECTSSWPVRSGYTTVPDAYAQRALKGLCSVHVPDTYAHCKHQFLTRMLISHFSSWHICLAHVSVPDAHAQGTHQFLTCKLRVCISSWCVCSACLKGTAFCACISTWCVCSLHAPFSDSYAQLTHQSMTCMLSVRISSWLACQCTHQFLTLLLRAHKINIWKIGKLMRMLSMHVRNWCVWSGCASVSDPYAQCVHKGRSMRVRNSICLIIFKVPITAKI